MRLDDRMLKVLVGLLALSSGLQSCMSNANDCVQNGSCPRDTTGAGGAGGIGGNGGTTTATACDSHPECGSCDGGVLQPTAAGTWCEGDQVCDGEGNCVACDDTAHLCPSGYECNGGECGRAKGASCDESVQCASGFCVDGHCCANECIGECTYCNADTQFSCNKPEANDTHPACDLTNGEACDGNGNCLLLGGRPCTTDGECISGDCRFNNTCD